MKRLLLIAFTVGGMLPQLFSQVDSAGSINPASIRLGKTPRFYLNIHSGYSRALGSTFKFYPDDISSVSVESIRGSNPTKTTEYKIPSRGLGEGFRYGLGLSYIINDFINVGLDFDYFRSTISKPRDSSYLFVQTVANRDTVYQYNERYTISYDATLLTVTPNITFKAISRPKFFIYTKIGAVITYRPNSIQKEAQNINVRMGWQGFFKDSSAQVNKRYDWGLRNPAFGFMGSIGGQLKLTETVRAFTEVQFSHIVFAVRNRELNSFTVNGQERVNSLSLSQRKIEFEKEFTDRQEAANPNEPTKAITQKFPVTYVGIQVGLAYRF